MGTRRLHALDGLRGFAALIVVLYHVLGRSRWFHSGMYDFTAEGTLAGIVTLSPVRVVLDGHVAVMSFFVLSGFVLSRRFWRGQSTAWVSYLARRVARLYPPVVASTVFALVLVALRQSVTGSGDGLVDLEEVGTSLTDVLTNMGLLGLTESPLNVVWWSLRWEMWFSILLPIVLLGLVLTGCGPKRRLRAMPLVFGLACLVVVGAQPWIRVTYQTSGAVSRALLYLPMFGVGVAVAAFESRLAAVDRMRRGWAAWSVFAIAITLLSLRGPMGALAASGAVDRRLGIGLAEALPLAGTALIVVLLVGWPVGVRVASTPAIAWVGERSYSLYLVHFPLIGLFAAVFAVDGAPLWFIVFCMVVSLAVTVPFHRWVEQPSTRLSARFRDRRSDGARTGASADAPGAMEPAHERAHERVRVG